MSDKLQRETVISGIFGLQAAFVQAKQDAAEYANYWGDDEAERAKRDAWRHVKYVKITCTKMEMCANTYVNELDRINYHFLIEED